jgi:hypothetical protein
MRWHGDGNSLMDITVKAITFFYVTSSVSAAWPFWMIVRSFLAVIAG